MNYWRGSNRKWESEYMKDEFQAVVSWGLSQTSLTLNLKMNFWNCILLQKNWERIYFFCSGTLLLLFIWFTFDIWERGTSEVHFLCLLADSQSTEDVFFCLLDLLAPLVFVPSRRNAATKTQDKGAQFDSKPADLNRSFFFAESFLPFLSHSWPEATGGFSLRKKKRKWKQNVFINQCVISGIQEWAATRLSLK